mmetsp:Transcript_30033/g.54741  ORF Transcript_30033/g.54741 Transcript_30033/m.54741 type:complete len:386 (+) Transcript_30033:94-1251(+)
MAQDMGVRLCWAVIAVHLACSGHLVRALQAQSAGESSISTGKFLISSFPDLKQVAYCALPDTVWRPLVVGDVVSPRALAVDSGHSRLFVADAGASRVYYYDLYKRDGSGLLFTTGVQKVALWGYDVYWMTTNGDGDLYFTGKQIVAPPESTYDSVFRVDYESLQGGASSAIEIYTRSNSGAPTPAVWMPGGIAVDSFYVYWTNQEEGATAGSVNKGPRMNIGDTSTLDTVAAITTNTAENRGMAVTNSYIFWLATDGVYGISKGTAAGATLSADEGLIAEPPSTDSANAVWDPRSIAFDGEGTMYVTDNLAGKVYTFAGTNTFPHPLEKFVDAPGVHGVTVLQIWGTASSDTLAAALNSGTTRHFCGLLSMVLALCLSSFRLLLN